MVSYGAASSGQSRSCSFFFIHQFLQPWRLLLDVNAPVSRDSVSDEFSTNYQQTSFVVFYSFIWPVFLIRSEICVGAGMCILMTLLLFWCVGFHEKLKNEYIKNIQEKKDVENVAITKQDFIEPFPVISGSSLFYVLNTGYCCVWGLRNDFLYLFFSDATLNTLPL